MPGESQQTPDTEPDPSVLTTEQILREVGNHEKYSDAQLASFAESVKLRVESIRREMEIKEAHRLELKGDSEKALSTAMIAAEKAVQAALAAAEKARDQQTIASQLATTKSEDASKEQLKQQGETFTTAITALTVGFNDVKAMLGELRAERRGGNEHLTDRRAGITVMSAVVGTAVVAMSFGLGIASLFMGR